MRTHRETQDYDPEFSAGDVMFRDLQQSATELEDYQRRIDDSADDLDRCLTVMVLTHAKWPSFKENNMLESEESARTHQNRRGGKASAPTTHVDLPPKVGYFCPTGDLPVLTPSL